MLSADFEIMKTPHRYQDLIKLFDATFFTQYNTRLVKGADEPIYLPANVHCHHHQVIFAHGYYASALHEISHWCLAGDSRRLLEDFGYWYLPDGRNAEQQKTFEQVEIKPQAIEWGFCIATKNNFNVSADNLNGAEAGTANFKRAVFLQVQEYLSIGFPIRAQQFINTLACFYQVPLPLTLAQFTLDSKLTNKELYKHV
jgi:elongation factor P hydroxylase